MALVGDEKICSKVNNDCAVSCRPESNNVPLSSSFDYDGSLVTYYVGMVIASCFSLSYFVTPFYIITAVWFTLIGYPTTFLAILYSSPGILSILFPPRQMPLLVKSLSPICAYFNYEEIREKSPIDPWKEIFVNDKNYLCVFQPHGVISFGGICSACTGQIPDLSDKFPTAVADAILLTPILKHILGVFGLISASKRSLQKALAKKGPAGCVVLYVGGIAELFLSSKTEEKLYLKARKGFIKLALQEGVDVIPIYLFGNTSVLSVLRNEMLAYLSRKLQVSITYVWGRFFLPIPRDCKILYVSGQPLGMPKIENPSNAEIDFWHAKYCSEVTRIFDTYKERVPEYKHKNLTIV